MKNSATAGRHSIPRGRGLAWAIFILPLTSAFGSTYYIDYVDGSDSDNGTSSASAFQHCPGDSAATGKAKITPATGDTIIFKGGVAYLGFITCPTDGVTYDGNSAGTFGTGKAVFNGQNSTANIYGITAYNRTGLVFNNLEIEDYGGHGSIAWTGTETKGYYGYGLYLDGCSNATVTNCYFHDIGDWQNVVNANEGYMEGVGLAIIDSGNAITISNNEFTKIGRGGIMIEPKQGTQICQNISITQNDFHDYLRWGVWLSTGNTNCTLNGITVDGNAFHDFYQYATPNWLGLVNCAPHVDCIIAYIGAIPPQGGQTLGTTANPITIRNNAFYNTATVAEVQNSAIFLNTWGGRVQIYNNEFTNVLYDGNGAIFCLEGTDTTINPAPDYWIANNSFYDSTYAVSLESDLYPIKNGSVHILNNIFSKPDSGYGFSVRVLDSNSTPTQMDYNTYYTGRSDDMLGVLLTGYLSLAGLRAQGWEQHGQQADPQYLSTAGGLGPNSASNNLHLKATSPAIGAGLNLSTLFTTDHDGASRPAIAAWDAGACQYSAAAVAGLGATAPGTSNPVVTLIGNVLGSVTNPLGTILAGGTVASTTSTTTSSNSSTSETSNSSASGSSTVDSSTSSTTTTNSLNSVILPAGSAAIPSRLVNISARANCSNGADALVAGFVVTGGNLQVLARGVGPGLAEFGVTGVVSFPELTLYSGSQAIGSNDKWGGTDSLEEAFQASSAFDLNPGSNDAALVSNLPAGSYTAQVVSGDGDTGMAMAEVYEDDPAIADRPDGHLANLSARARVGSGNNSLVIGFVITGTEPETVMIRGVGPTLTEFGISGALPDPQLSLYQGSTVVEQNSGGLNLASLSDVSAESGAFPLASAQDSAIVITLPPGAYTAVMSSISGDSGLGMAEIYDVPNATN